MTSPVPPTSESGNRPSRVLHFACGERDVVPAVGGEDRSHLRNAESDEKPQSAACRRNRRSEGDSRLNSHRASRSPEIAEIARNHVRIPPDDEAEQD